MQDARSPVFPRSSYICLHRLGSSIKDVHMEEEGYGPMQTKVDKGEGTLVSADVHNQYCIVYCI